MLVSDMQNGTPLSRTAMGNRDIVREKGRGSR